MSTNLGNPTPSQLSVNCAAQARYTADYLRDKLTCRLVNTAPLLGSSVQSFLIVLDSLCVDEGDLARLLDQV